eukprot:GSChrysophyteH1.ASY1.ANO1.460.1 assembled CDS
MPKTKQISLHQALEDVEVRFLMNMPESELSKIDRLFFQIEQAWWFYEDFYADAQPHLPHYKRLPQFAKQIFDHCPLLAEYKEQYAEFFADYSAYKSIIPSYGTILLSPNMKKFVLCQAYKGNSWSFPRGKVNQGEDSLGCACRETFEETGFDPTAYVKEEDFVVWMEGSKLTKLYIATNVPLNTRFLPQTRKEVGCVEFVDIESVLSKEARAIKTWGVIPFYSNIKRWIKRNRDPKTKSANKTNDETDANRNSDRNVKKNGRLLERSHLDGKNVDTFSFSPGKNAAAGWSVKDMFKTNEVMTGKTFANYDGSAHKFGAYHPRYVDFNAQSGKRGPNDGFTTPAPHEIVSHTDILKLNIDMMKSPEKPARTRLLQRQEMKEGLLKLFATPFKVNMKRLRKAMMKHLEAE